MFILYMNTSNEYYLYKFFILMNNIYNEKKIKVPKEYYL